VITHQGLAAAVEALAERTPLPVHIDVPDERYPASVESAAYFIAAEALTNVANYANASTATVTARSCARSLVLTIADDGTGGGSACATGGYCDAAGLMATIRASSSHFQ
jgi:signal transduction histidine kinase